MQSLIRDYLEVALTAEETAEIEHIFTVLLDDPSPLVRRALAAGLGDAPGAPHHVISALAADQADIATLVLRSPRFSGAELVEIARHSDSALRMAIALRPNLPAEPAAFLAAQAEPAVLFALASNRSAIIPEAAQLKIIERAGEIAVVREALLARADVSVPVRIELAQAVGDALSRFLATKDWLSQERVSRIIREARDRVVVAALDDRRESTGAAGAAASLAKYLRSSGQLTSSLLLRSLVSGDLLLFQSALVELSGLPRDRVAALAERPEGGGFRAVYRRAGLPASVLPAFVALLAAIGDGRSLTPSAAPRRELVAVALAACGEIAAGQRGTVLALLRRLEADAAREEARGAGQATRAGSRRMLEAGLSTGLIG